MSIDRHAANDELNSQHDYWQLSLYVGPSSTVPGAIRRAAVVLINNCVHHIITTTTIKGVSNGGHIAIYPHRTPTSSASWKSTPQIQMQILQFSKVSVPASSLTFLSKVLRVQQFEQPDPAQHQFPLHPQSFNLSQCLHRHLFQLLDPYCSFP